MDREIHPRHTRKVNVAVLSQVAWVFTKKRHQEHRQLKYAARKHVVVQLQGLMGLSSFGIPPGFPGSSKGFQGGPVYGYVVRMPVSPDGVRGYYHLRLQLTDYFDDPS